MKYLTGLLALALMLFAATSFAEAAKPEWKTWTTNEIQLASTGDTIEQGVQTEWKTAEINGAVYVMRVGEDGHVSHAMTISWFGDRPLIRWTVDYFEKEKPLWPRGDILSHYYNRQYELIAQR